MVSLHARVLVGLIGVGLALAGCGGGSKTGTQSAPETVVPGESNKPAAPEFYLTGDRSETPDDWSEVEANCQSRDGQGQWIFDFLIPGNWEPVGAGNSGGGGAGHSGYGNNIFAIGGDRDQEMYFTVQQDDFDDEGQLLDKMKQPTEPENLDYSINVNGTDTKIAFQMLQPLSIDGAEAVLGRLGKGEAERDDEAQYTTRLRYANVPAHGDPESRRDWSATVTIAWYPDKTDLDEDTARSILESFRLPQCAQDDAIQYLSQSGFTEFA